MKTKVIAVMNLKGGVGKTVTAINLAADLAHYHRKNVLVVDADSQANATEFLGGGREDHSLATLLRLPTQMRTAFTVTFEAAQAICASTVPNVDLLPADDTLMDLDLSKAASGDAWVECLAELKTNGSLINYHYVVVDCPPAFNAAAAAALLAADEVIIPIKLDAFSLRGLANLNRQIQNMHKINQDLRVAGLLPVMWYNSDENKKALAMLRESRLHVFPLIRRSNLVDAMTYCQKPLYISSPKSAACHDYKTVARIIAEGWY